MRTPARSSRVSTALQVIQQMNSGVKVVDACRAVGIPRSTFYYIAKNNPEAIAKYQDIIAANARDQLGLILMSRTVMLRKVIENGLSDTTKPRDRLTIYKALDAILNDLTRTLQVENPVETKAQ